MPATLESHVHRWEPAQQAPRTLLLLHGTGGDENDLVDLARSIDPAASLLSPRGNVLENGAPRFFRRLREGVFDLPDLRARTAALADWIRAAIAHYQIDPTTLYALGYSNGANTAAALMLLHPGVIRGGILMRAMMPIDPDTPPQLTGNRVLLLTGAADPIVPPAGADRLETALTAAGATVSHQRLRASHQLTHDDLSLSRAWIAG